MKLSLLWWVLWIKFLQGYFIREQTAVCPSVTCSIYASTARAYCGENNQRTRPTLKLCFDKTQYNEQHFASGASENIPLIWLLQMRLPAMVKENKIKSTNIIIFINIWKADRQWHEWIFHTAPLALVKILIQQGDKNSHLILSRDFQVFV